MSEDKVKRQIELEEESVSTGYARYMKDREYSRDHKTEDETVPGNQLISRVIDAVGAGIEVDRNATRRGKNRAGVDLVAELESPVLAWHALRAIVRGIALTPQTFVQVATRAGMFVRDEINFRRFSEHEPLKYKITQAHIKRQRSAQGRRDNVAHIAKGEGTDVLQWGTEDLIRAGSYIVDLALAITGWGKVVTVRQRTGKTPKIIQPTPEILQWIEDAHEELALLAPQRLPMLVEPIEWSGPSGGGYLTDVAPPLTLVKTRNRDYLASLVDLDMPVVYAAINRIQSTPWSINGGVLAVAKELYQLGVQVGPTGSESLPSREPQPLPARPALWGDKKVREIKGLYGEEYKLWAGRAAEVHEQNRRLASKRLSSTAAMNLAERFVEDTIYFPHQLDFRGRLYPVSAYLQPQGDDLCKGLLRFAEGKPLGAEGVTWLKIHIANCFGVDKVSYAERVAWTDAHTDALLESALNPMDPDAFWLTADEPFQALAACYEFAGWYAEGDDYVSHLPVAVDGSCNGLQNFSALLKDEIGGRATNLVPGESPADLYAEVAALAAARVRSDAEDGHEYAVMFDGFVNRSLVKQPVMTLPYGATLAGMREQLLDAVRRAGNPMAIPLKETWSACGYLAVVVRDAISQVVVAAVQAMGWLRKVSSVASSDEHPVTWTTPTGFPVLQEYRVSDCKRLSVHINGERRIIHIDRIGQKLNKTRQSNGIAPNYVHSLDSSHLMSTVALAEANGVASFMVIHDSFGTHAADMGTLQASIRHAFVEQYRPSLLSTFKAELEAQYNVQLPEVPPMGDLELDAIIDSLYFFA